MANGSGQSGPLGPGMALLQRLGWGAQMGLMGLLAVLPWLLWGLQVQLAGAARWGGVVAVAGVQVCLALALYRTHRASMQRLVDGVDAMRRGDLTQRIDLTGPGEHAAMAGVLDAVNARLSAMVADVRSDSVVVSLAGQSLASGSDDLSQRTERQAASLEETSASVQELSGTVRRNAEDASEVLQLATRVHGIAEAGGQRMREAVDSVQTIRHSAEQMNQIIGVIDGIAFQTNILALNAAVEAARAGEQGRGFAVVASEVRALAQRSAGAAQEIKALIVTSQEQVNLGVRAIDQVSGMLGEIVEGVGQVAGNVQSIASAAQHQSVALAEITQAIGSLDDITQQNAQLVERASTDAHRLGERAQRLARAVGGFKLRQGTADEAYALVQKAQARYQQIGQGALAEFTDAAKGYTDRDMYVFAWDRQLIYRAFGGKPANVGKQASQVLGTDTRQLGQDVWNTALAGGGWVDYDFLNPATGQVAPKTSYVVQVSDDLVLGCGIYKTLQGS